MASLQRVWQQVKSTVCLLERSGLQT